MIRNKSVNARHSGDIPTMVTSSEAVVQLTATTQLPYTNENNSCNCLNGGICVIDTNNVRYCRCPHTYVGPHCGDIEISELRSHPDHLEYPSIATFGYVVFGSLVIFVLFTFIWRKYKSFERNIWHKWQASRKQSKSTIEGHSVSLSPPMSGVNAAFSRDDKVSTYHSQFYVKEIKDNSTVLEMPGQAEKSKCLPDGLTYFNDIENYKTVV